jgi:hypothetical protein
MPGEGNEPLEMQQPDASSRRVASDRKVSRVGVEPTTRRLKDRPATSEIPTNSRQSDAFADPGCTGGCTDTSELARLVERWPTLPAHIRAAVMALVNTAPPADPSTQPRGLDDSLPPGFEKRGG